MILIMTGMIWIRSNDLGFGKYYIFERFVYWNLVNIIEISSVG